MARGGNTTSRHQAADGGPGFGRWRLKPPQAMPAWGCLWRTVLFTLALLALNLVMGFLLGM